MLWVCICQLFRLDIWIIVIKQVYQQLCQLQIYIFSKYCEKKKNNHICQIILGLLPNRCSSPQGWTQQDCYGALRFTQWRGDVFIIKCRRYEAKERANSIWSVSDVSKKSIFLCQNKCRLSDLRSGPVNKSLFCAGPQIPLNDLTLWFGCNVSQLTAH